ncbi:MAG: four helix bundle protein [candidate division SR1 bacterium]|nr:four helix bundle protein [candidate division SR1 bacterium]
MKENLIQQKTLEFSIKLAKFYMSLKDKKYYEIASQLFRSGTSIGANVAEAQGAISKKDFINKMTIALKESYETLYRLEILEHGFDEHVVEIKSDCESIVRILVTIVKSSKE